MRRKKFTCLGLEPGSCGFDVGVNLMFLHFILSTEEVKKSLFKSLGSLRRDSRIFSKLYLHKNLKHQVSFFVYKFFTFYSKWVRGTKKFVNKNVDSFMTDLEVPSIFLLHE